MYSEVVVLLVEDNDADARLTVEVLKERKFINSVYRVRDGVEALEFLRKEGEFSHVPKVTLILLDLNMPRKDGRELLRDIRSDEDLKIIPVIILTTSSSEIDILKSYQLQCNAYIVKPIDLDEFIKVLQKIEDFWFSIVKLPTGSHL